jgi:hypothetical protein
LGVHQALKPEEKSKALNKKYVVDDRITVLEELDSAMEVFLNAVDKQKSEDAGQRW